MAGAGADSGYAAPPDKDVHRASRLGEDGRKKKKKKLNSLFVWLSGAE